MKRTTSAILLVAFSYKGFSSYKGIARVIPAAVLVLVFLQIAVGMAVVETGLYFAATAQHLAVALTILFVLGRKWVCESSTREAE